VTHQSSRSWTQGISRCGAPAVALLGAAAWSQPAASGTDLWWHLAAGREIWKLGGPPPVDHFSFTFEGRPWLNHEWLWDALFWGFYRLDPQAVAWLNLALLLVVFAVTYAVARRESGSVLAAGAALWLVAASSHWFLNIRPHVVTLLFTAVVLYTRDSSRRWWLWPALMLIWANAHGGFVFGVGMIGLWVLASSAQASVRRRRLVLPGRDWTALGLCLLAWLVTPWGLASLDYPLQYLDSGSPFRGILEWRPPGFAWDLRDYRGLFWLLALVAFAGFPRALQRSPYLVALGMVSFAMAFTSRRFIPLFAVTAAPLAALAIEGARRRLVRWWPGLARPQVVAAVTAAALVAALLLWRDVRVHPHLLERWTVSDVFPEDALHYLKALGPPRRLLNERSWGGYVMLKLPQSRVFIDGRANTLYDDELYLDYLALRAASPGLQERLGRYAPDAALLVAGAPLARALVSLPQPWTAAYEDSIAAVLLPPGSPQLAAPLPAVAAVLAGRVGYYEHRVWVALAEGDVETAIQAVEGALERDPLQIRAYWLLMALYAEWGDPEGVARTLAAGLRENPRRWIDLHLAEGDAYERLGDLPRSLRAYEKAVSTAPFVSPDPALANLRRIWARLQREGGDSPAPQ